MATAHTMTNHQGRNLLVPTDTLNIQGRGLSPHRMNDASMLSMTSSIRSSISDDDEESSQKSEEYTVLDGVREMNHILVRQIETLRLKIQVDEKNSENEKTRIREEKEQELKKKENKIEDLKDSLVNRDERIHGLVRAGHEKDRQIETKTQEIETLKELVRQSEKYAEKLQKQVSRVVSDKDRLEDDPLYKKQNEEMGKLTEELETLRERLASMELELQRAMKIIDMQNSKMKTILEEKSLIHANFREELDRVSKAMRQEVERMREVMRQNYEEMRNLREENKQMHDDVRDIKEMLKATRATGGQQNRSDQRPITAASSNLYSRQSKSGGPGYMTGGNIAHTPSTRSQRNLKMYENNPTKSLHGSIREPTQMLRGRQNVARSSFRSSNQTNCEYEYDEQYSQNTTSGNAPTNSSASPARASMDTHRSSYSHSPDPSARTIHDGGLTTRAYSINTPAGSRQGQAPHPPNVPQQRDGKEAKNFPPIATLKESGSVLARKSVPRSSIISKSAIRRGSAIKK